MKEDQTKQNTAVSCLWYTEIDTCCTKSQRTIWIYIGVWCLCVGGGWRGYRNQGEQISSLMGCSHKWNFISVAVRYEGNLKWILTTRNRSQITQISSDIIELCQLLKNFSLQTLKWRWHDIFSVLGRLSSHHRHYFAISVLTAPLVCPPETVFQIHKCCFTNLRENQRRCPCHLTMLLYCSWHYHCQSQGIPLNTRYWKPQRMKRSRNGTHKKTCH